jgi:hypothetical protein
MGILGGVQWCALLALVPSMCNLFRIISTVRSNTVRSVNKTPVTNWRQPR